MWWYIIILAFAIGLWKTRIWLKLLWKGALSSPCFSTLTFSSTSGEGFYRVPYFHNGKWGAFEIQGVELPFGWDVTVKESNKGYISLLKTKHGRQVTVYGLPLQVLREAELHVTIHPIPDLGTRSSHKSVTIKNQPIIFWRVVLDDLVNSKQTGAACLMEACD